MTKKLKNKLVNALKSAGMSEVLADLFDDKADAEIEKFIKELPNTEETDFDVDDVIAEEDILIKAAEKIGFDKLIEKSKNLQSAFDKRMDKGLKTFKENLLKDDEPDDKTKKKPEDTKVDDDMPAWAKGLVADIQSLKQKTEAETSEKKASDAMKGAKLPEKLKKKWLSRLDVSSETSLEDQVKELEEEYGEFAGEVETSDDGTYEFHGGRQKPNGQLSKSEEKELSEIAKKI